MLGVALGLHWSPRLGLDLRGGLEVVYQPKHKVSNDQLQTVVTIMQNRVAGFGVSAGDVSSQGNSIVVDIPGAKNQSTLIKQLGTTAEMFFRPVLCGAPAYTPPTPVKGKPTPVVKYVTPPTCAAPYAYSASYFDASAANGGQYEVPAEYAEDPTYASYKSTPSTDDNPRKNVIFSTNGQGEAERYVLGPAVIDGQVINGTIIKTAFSQLQTNGVWSVVFNLTSRGSTLFNDLAAANYQKLVANDLDGTIVSAPSINDTNFNGSVSVTGSFTQASANALALNLQYGALPVPLTLLTSESISASLGASSLRAGLLAGLLGLLLVMGYGVFYYRALGIVIIVGLLTTGAFLYGFISFLGWSSLHLTLDLSGVTGLIVSVGITVDSYVVYFERLKDEVRAGRSIRASVDRGFKSAFRTILSADAVSLIGAIVLWWLSVGDVRGFAFMLGLSTLTDVATAFIFTRPLVILLGRNRTFTDARHLGIARGLAIGPSQ
jgi:preprotein translocase subunit SecD